MNTNINELEILRGCTRNAHSEVRHAYNELIASEMKAPASVIARLRTAVYLLIRLDDYFVGEIKKASKEKLS